MKTLRRLHLYLGCLFAPLIVFFAISGTWQMLIIGATDEHGQARRLPPWLQLASTLHTAHGLKSQPSTLSSPAFRWLSIAMAVALVVTVVLGVVMAFRYGHGAVTFVCLAFGLAIPLLLAIRQFYG